MSTRDVWVKNPYQSWKTTRYYASTAAQRCGEMICCNCRTLISFGLYSYKQNNEGEYIAHKHRACSESDPQWALIDAEQNQVDERDKAFKLACKQFAELWGVDDLDHYFEDD